VASRAAKPAINSFMTNLSLQGLGGCRVWPDSEFRLTV
jgi:hypothetical protein